MSLSRFLLTAGLLVSATICRAQFTDCTSGLMQMPTAQIQEDGTFMITNNFLNSHSLSSYRWGYDTFQYGFDLAFFGRAEIAYVCVLVNGKKRANPTERDLIMVNQDRHFSGKLLLLREKEFGLDWLPALAVGAIDPITGNSYGEKGNYIEGDVSAEGNGFFNRYYVIATKHFSTPVGELGAHLGYQYNLRREYSINAPCAGVDLKLDCFRPGSIFDHLTVMAEFDSRTLNVGFATSIWDNRFETMFELQGLRWVNFGARYKLRIKK